MQQPHEDSQISLSKSSPSILGEQHPHTAPSKVEQHPLACPGSRSIMLISYTALREHLLNTQAQNQAPPQPQQPPQPSSHHDNVHSPPRHDHQIDPAISPSNYHSMMQDEEMEDQSSDIRKGRRELSTSKRAAQNRAAQRAFRQRKEAYITSLQEKCREYESLIGNYKAIQQENFQLREYIIQLQSKLIGEVPPAPANIDLQNPPDRPVPRSLSPAEEPLPPTTASSARPIAAMSSNNADQLQLAAAAAAEAAAPDQSSKPDAGPTTQSNPLATSSSAPRGAAPTLPGMYTPLSSALPSKDQKPEPLYTSVNRYYPVPYGVLKRHLQRQGLEFEEHALTYPEVYAQVMTDMLTERSCADIDFRPSNTERREVEGEGGAEGA